jgi:hypothetical protein
MSAELAGRKRSLRGDNGRHSCEQCALVAAEVAVADFYALDV